MDTFNKICNQSNEIIEDIQSVSDEFGIYSLNKTLKSIRNFANQNQYLDIAVLGQFKAGKSSFLNSLIGQPLLPIGNIPVTSVITRTKFGPKERATVTFEDGTSQQIQITEINHYVSEAGLSNFI